MKIGIKVTAIAILPIILTALVILAIALYENSLLNRFFADEIDRQARNEAQRIAQDVYLMCRSALGPFYARFGFYPLELSAMPRYFQRASQVAGALEVLKLLQESVLVMRVD